MERQVVKIIKPIPLFLSVCVLAAEAGLQLRAAQVAGRPANRTVQITGDHATYFKQSLPGYTADSDHAWIRCLRVVQPNGVMQADVGASPSLFGRALSTMAFTAKLDGPWALTSASGHWYSSAKRFGLETDPTAWSPWSPETVFNTYIHRVTTFAPINPEVLTAPDPAAAPKLLFGPPLQYYDGISTMEPRTQTDHIVFRFTNGDNRSAMFRKPTGNDGDGYSRTSNFYLHLHPEHEYWQSAKKVPYDYLHSGIPNDVPDGPNCYHVEAKVTAVPPGLAATGGAIGISWVEPQCSYTTVGQRTPLLTRLANYLSPTPPKVDTTTIDFDGCWDSGSGIWPTAHPKGTAERTSYQMIPRMILRYKRIFTLDDTYGENGFVRETMHETDQYLGPLMGCGRFVYIGM